jgi:hypothetical protein
LVEIALGGGEDRRSGILGEWLELVLGGFGLSGVEGSLGDLVDVVGVEVAQLLVEVGLLGRRELIIESLIISVSKYVYDERVLGYVVEFSKPFSAH